MPADDPLAWPAATSGWRRLAVFGIGGSVRAGLGLCATERLRPAGGSLGEAHPRWFQSYGRDWLSRRSVATNTVAAVVTGSKLLSRSAASVKAVVLVRCHERLRVWPRTY